MKQLLAVAEAAYQGRLAAYPYGTGTSASALPGMRRSAVNDAVGLAPSLQPRLGAVAITVTTSALDRGVSGVVCHVWRRVHCVPGFGYGLARESVGGVGFEVGL